MSTAEVPVQIIDLQISGMTCSSWAALVQKKLDKRPALRPR
jgi:hypothetical protein